ncbi:MAG: DUF192 domain-containing protein [bacterium]
MKMIHYPSQMYLPIRIVAVNAFMARGFWRRLLGLMFRRAFKPMDAMIFAACRAIHTHFMKFPIDVICLNSSNFVCDIADTIKPGRVFVPRIAPSYLIELPAGTIREYGIKNGDFIVIDK